MPPRLDRLASQFLGDHRTVGRLDGHDLEVRFLGLERLATAGDRAAGAHAAHQDVDLSFGIFPDFRGRRPAVNLGVGRVLKLLRHEKLAARAADLVGVADRTGHAFCRRREHKLGSECLEHSPAFEAHALRHGHPQMVAAGGADIGQADPRVAAGGLDDDGVGADQPVPLGGIDHGGRDAVLHAPERIHVLDLAHDRCHAAFSHPPQPDERRPTDALRNVVANPCRQHGHDHEYTYWGDFEGIISMFTIGLNEA